MNNDTTATASRTPIHLWIVGVLALLWNGFGAYDYIMTRTNGAAYLAEMMPGVDGAGYMAYINAFPIWVSSAWAIGVWAGLAGTILLLMRHRWAVPTLLLSFVGAVIGIGYQILKPSGIAEMERGFNAYVGYLVIAIALGLFLYARAMRTRNVLA